MNKISLRLIGFYSSIMIFLIVIWLMSIDNATSLFIASPIISYSSIQDNDTYNIPMQQMAGINHTINNTFDVTINNTYDVRSSKNIDEEESVRNPKLDTLETTLLNSTSYPSFYVFTNNSCINYDSANRTIYLCGGGTNLSTINRVINSSDALNNTSDKNWILNANISIANNATLFINSTDTQWLRINSTAPQPYSIVAYGNLVINGTKISSWNSTSNTESVLKNDTNESTPRSYLLMPQQATGHMNITNSNISGLGFKSIKDTWGITYYSGSGSILKNNTISSNFRGLHLAGNVSNILVSNNTIQNSSQHGLDLFRANNIKILENNVSSNNEHGIYCTRECEKTSIRSNIISDNGKSGIVLGYATTDSIVGHNILQSNNGSAIAIRNSSRNTVDDNIVEQNGFGVAISQNSTNNSVMSNSISNSNATGVLLNSHSKNNTIEKNLIQHSNGAGMNVDSAFDNNIIRNQIFGNAKSGVVFLNATKNILVSNNLSANSPYNYYLRSNSTFNVIRDTFFDNSTLRFFDNSSNLILENTNNRIINSNKKIPSYAYATNSTAIIQPVYKNIQVSTLDMFAIPSADYIQLFSIDKDFNTNQTNKNWLERSPQLPSLSENMKASTKYIIGSFPPYTQVEIRANDSFWNAYTSNGSGYISFVYDGYGEAIKEALGELPPYAVTEFEAAVTNSPTMAAIIFFAALIAGSVAFLIIRIILKRKRKKIADKI
jgi:parallel beta-helix repeat protein